MRPLYKDSSAFSDALSVYRSRGFKLTAFVPNSSSHFPDLNEIDCVMYNAEFKTALDKAIVWQDN